jgi:hypothetical protein
MILSLYRIDKEVARKNRENLDMSPRLFLIVLAESNPLVNGYDNPIKLNKHLKKGERE